MKATGIVRRIDELGRIVIPKEIRKTLRIREGDPMEIYTDVEGGITLRKYSPLGDLTQFAMQYAEALAKATGHIVCIADRDQIIAIAGTRKKDMLGKSVSKELEKAVNDRVNIVAKKGDKKFVNLIDMEGEYVNQVICPIIAEGDVIGAVAVLDNENNSVLGECELKLASCAAMFFRKQIEL